MDPTLADDARLAARLVEAAGERLLRFRAESGLEGKALGAAADALACELLMAALRAERPDDAILCEEAKDDPVRLSHRRVWIVDPLDGTREYGEGRADWAVHVALAVDGVAAAGAVALPGGDGVWTSLAGRPGGARRSERPRMVVSRTRPAPEAESVARRLGAELAPMGSAGAKAMAVVRGEAEIYLHGGGQWEWDSCAPVAVAAAYGLHVSRADGSPLVYNRADPYLPDLLICDPVWAPRVLGR